MLKKSHRPVWDQAALDAELTLELPGGIPMFKDRIEKSEFVNARSFLRWDKSGPAGAGPPSTPLRDVRGSMRIPPGRGVRQPSGALAPRVRWVTTATFNPGTIRLKKVQTRSFGDKSPKRQSGDKSPYST